MSRSIKLVLKMIFIATLASDSIALYDVCGIRNISSRKAARSSYVPLGTEADHNEFPWHVSLQRYWTDGLYNGFKPICGGTIVSNLWVLTSAHCFGNATLPVIPRMWFVYRGVKYMNAKKLMALSREEYEVEHAKRWKVSCVIRHDAYDGGLQHNLALVKTPGRLLKRRMMPICLRPYMDKGIGSFEGIRCVMAGWGSNVCRLDVTKVLTFGEYTLHDWKSCKTSYADNPALSEQINEKIICAGGYSESGGTCPGDIGGALTCERNGRYYLIGVIAPTPGCSLWKPAQPSLAIDVGAYNFWIYSTIGWYG